MKRNSSLGAITLTDEYPSGLVSTRCISRNRLRAMRMKRGLVFLRSEERSCVKMYPKEAWFRRCNMDSPWWTHGVRLKMKSELRKSHWSRALSIRFHKATHTIFHSIPWQWGPRKALTACIYSWMVHVHDSGKYSWIPIIKPDSFRSHGQSHMSDFLSKRGNRGEE